VSAFAWLAVLAALATLVAVALVKALYLRPLEAPATPVNIRVRGKVANSFAQTQRINVPRRPVYLVREAPAFVVVAALDGEVLEQVAMFYSDRTASDVATMLNSGMLRTAKEVAS
jgi:hypothetical protein